MTQKILLITDAWAPQTNGNAKLFEIMTKLLLKQGIDMIAIHPGHFQSVPLPMYPELPVTLATSLGLQEKILEEKPDFIHLPTEWTLGLSARFACSALNVPYTTSYHTDFATYCAIYAPLVKHPISAAAYAYMRWFHKDARATLVSTESVRSDLASHGFKHLKLWPFGADTDTFRDSKSRTPPLDLPPQGRPLFGFVGRVAKEKNIEAFLSADLPGTKVVIGDGPERKRLENKYGDAVMFVGFQRGKSLVNWIRALDVLVFPSRSDTFGLVILEALACGTPVAAYPVTGPRDIITNGVDGFVDEDLAKAARACLSLSRENCRKKALTYSWDNSIKMFLKNIEPSRIQWPSDR